MDEKKAPADRRDEVWAAMPHGRVPDEHRGEPYGVPFMRAFLLGAALSVPVWFLVAGLLAMIAAFR